MIEFNQKLQKKIRNNLDQPIKFEMLEGIAARKYPYPNEPLTALIDIFRTYAIQ